MSLRSSSVFYWSVETTKSSIEVLHQRRRSWEDVESNLQSKEDLHQSGNSEIFKLMSICVKKCGLVAHILCYTDSIRMEFVLKFMHAEVSNVYEWSFKYTPSHQEGTSDPTRMNLNETLRSMQQSIEGLARQFQSIDRDVKELKKDKSCATMEQRVGDNLDVIHIASKTL
ncbi:hypothetical protein M9H77_02198 [Catharanthus roseus]|uniref:Uncharacterized protein n=1 Tax=Catharanthus roseus TaxID=4058 RepID=A0ACC0C7Q8_CATRO|nr:hypothetical protein M9H77_02198 [Catharanthus roseus]